MSTSSTIISYVTFLEARARRQRMVAELARPNADVMGWRGAAAASPLTLEGESVTVIQQPAIIQQPTTTVARHGLPVEL